MFFHLENLPSKYKSFEIFNWQKIKNIKSSIVKPQTPESFEEIGWRMVKTCLEDDGIGLAAPQVGLYTKIILCRELIQTENNFEAGSKFKMYINPSFEANTKKGKNQEKEYCLSVPGIGFPIKRFNEITLSWDEPEENGNFIRKTSIFLNWPARILQHEIDHLNGVSIPQRWQQQNQKPTSNKRSDKKKKRKK